MTSTPGLPPTLLASAAAAHDVAVGRLPLLARAVAERRHAPRRARMAARRVVRLAAAVRVVDGVHRHAARLRALAAVARAAGLAELDELVLRVAEHADGGDLGRHAVLHPLEVDLPVLALGPAAGVAGRHAPVRVAPAGLREPLGERLLRLVLLRDRLVLEV